MQKSAAFRHYPSRPETLTPEFVSSEYDKLNARVPAAEASPTAELWIQLFKDWDALKSYTESESSRARYRYSGNLANTELESADAFIREKISPVLDAGNSALLGAVMKSRHQAAIANVLSPQLFQVLETQIKPLDPRLADLRLEENRLTTEYRKLVGTAEIEFQGQKMTLTKLGSLSASPEAKTRKDAFLASRNWFLNHRPTLAKIFDDLVNVRQQMAEKMGDENYLKLGYMGMGRTDYGTKESAEFRRLVREYAVPLYQAINQDQANALGTPTLRPWDSSYHPKLVLPLNIVPIDSQADRAQKVFDRISPKLGAHFKNMREHKLIDLENRPGKAAGAFCTSFSDQAQAAIHCNSTGAAHDVTVLVHEMGHAFQMTESMQDERAHDLVLPTMDAAEIHSMGMEYLSLSRLDEFFEPEHLEKFKKERWKSAIALMCYVAIVDEFQHWIYENPKVSMDDRDEQWVKIAKIYQPGLDFSGHENIMPMRWYAQSHIFGMPFYYIDYAIAETGAMQLALLDAKDPKKAVEVYLELCRIGGTKSVLDIFKSAGLNSPFSAENMKNLMTHASAQLS
jgi:M3 family oligoendopeptidase